MQGPFTAGSLSGQMANSQSDWETRNLMRGEKYQVIKSFVDSDGSEHPVGEEWVCIGSMFSKFDDELAVCAKLQDGSEWRIPLIWKVNKQQNIIENWGNYVMLSK